MQLLRFEGNPILQPDTRRTWEGAYTTNPGAWYDGKMVHLLYRAGPDTDAHPIYFGLAQSRDGLHFRRVARRPVFGPSADGFDAGCVEDARIVSLGDQYAVTYATRAFPPGAYWRKTIALNAHNPPLPAEAPRAARDNLTRSGLALTKDFRTWHRLGPITDATVDDRDVILFPEKVGGHFLMLHRPAEWVGSTYGCTHPSMWLARSRDLLDWKEHHLLASPAFAWEEKKIGGSTPPLKTPRGWLVFYHGVDHHNIYRVGAMLLDLINPLRILARTPVPVLEPAMAYEREGIVPNVVFPTGNVIIGDRLYVYYGGADKVCCVATAPLAAFVDFVASHPWGVKRGKRKTSF